MAATGNEAVLVVQAKIMFDVLNGRIDDVAAGSPSTGSVTTESLADGAVTSSKIASGAVTADKISDGVIPDVSGFVTKTQADQDYQPKGSYLTSVPAASTTDVGGVKVVSDADFKTFLGIE